MSSLETGPGPEHHGGVATREGHSTVKSREKHHNDDPLRVVIASFDKNVDAFAREAAHEKLNKKHEGPLWKRMVKSAWGNLSREYQTVKETQKAREEIIENKNLLHHQGKSDRAWREATTMRMGSEYGEQLLREGETFHKLHEPEAQADPNAQRIVDDVKDFYRRFAAGEYNDADGAVDEASAQMDIDLMITSWRADNISEKYLGEGQLLAENMLETGHTLRGMIDSAEGLDAVGKAALAEEHIGNMQVVMSEANVGSQAEIDKTLSERVAGKLRRVPFIKEGRISRVASAVTSTLGNETVVAAAMSAGIYVAKRGASLAGKIIAPGVGGGLVAAIRERNALIRERDLEARRADAGVAAPEESDDGEASRFRKVLKKVGVGKTEDEYRAEVIATLYETRNVDELIDELGTLYDDELGELNIRSREDLEAAMETIGKIRARIDIGNQKRARLISFEGTEPEQMEQKRFDLAVTLAKVETDMDKLFSNPVAMGMLDIKSGETFKDLFGQQRAIAEGTIMGEMKRKDRLFNMLVMKRGLKRGIGAGFMGAAIGGAVHYGGDAVQHVGAAYQKFSDSLGGSSTPGMRLAGFEGDGSGSPTHFGESSSPTQFGGEASPAGPDQLGGSSSGSPTQFGGNGEAPTQFGGNSPSPTEFGSTGQSTGPEQLGGDGRAAPTEFGGNATPGPAEFGAPGMPEQFGSVDAGEATQLSENTKVNLPSGYLADVDSQNGTITITTPDGKEYSGLGLDKDGSFTKEALDTLKANGLTVNADNEIVRGAPEISQHTVSANEFVKNHKGEMKHFKITKWYVNNLLPKPGNPMSDLNELGIQNRVDSQGNILIDIRSMTANGSFNGKSGVNWHEAVQGGHIKAYLSASRGSQSKAFEFTFDKNGIAKIDKDSPAAALFTKDGKFTGGYEHVALNGGKTSDGAEKVASLATVVGRHDKSFEDVVKKPTMKTVHTYTIRPTAQPSAFTATTPASQPNTFPFTSTATFRRRLSTEGPDDTEEVEQPEPSTNPAIESADEAAESPEEAVTGVDADSSDNTTEFSDTSGPVGATSPEADADGGGSGAETTTPPTAASPGATPPAAGPASSPSSVPGAGADGADGGDGGAKTAETGSTPSPEEQYLKNLDAEPLATPTGYDFSRSVREGKPDYSDFGMRERKQAVRFINQAISEIGGNDRVAIITRAQELAAAAQQGASAEMGGLYAQAAEILRWSAERVKADAERNPGGGGFLKDLNSETRPFPHFIGLDSYSPQAQKLASRILWNVTEQVLKARNVDSMQDVDKGQRPQLQKVIIRRAQMLAQPFQYSGLSAEDQSLFNDALKLLNQAKDSDLF